MLESLFNKVAGPQALRPATLLKRDSNTGPFYEICEIFKNTFLAGKLQWLLLNHPKNIYCRA